MADYISDKEIQKVGFASPETNSVSGGGYLSDADVRNIGIQIPKEEISQLESGLRGAGQGVSMGFGDEITGGVQALGDVAFGDTKLSDIERVYSEFRDIQRAKNKAAQEANPWTYGGSELGGGIASAFIPGLNIAKGATLARTAGIGALTGGASAIGLNEESLSDPANLKKLGYSVPTSAVLGGGLGAIAHGIASLPKLTKESSTINDIYEAFRRGRKGENLTSTDSAKKASENIYKLGQDTVKEVKTAGGAASKQYGEALSQNTLDLKNPVRKELLDFEQKLKNQLLTEKLPGRIKETQSMLDEVQGALKTPKDALLQQKVDLTKALTPELEAAQSQPILDKIKSLDDQISSSVDNINPRTTQNLKEGFKEQSFLAKNPDSSATNKALAKMSTDYAEKMADILKKNVPGLKEASGKLGASKKMEDLLNLSNEIFQSDALKNKARTAELFKRLEQEGIKGQAAADIINQLRSLSENTGSSKLVGMLGKNADEISKVYDLTRKTQQEGLNMFSRSALSVGAPNLLARTPILGAVVSAATQAATFPGAAAGLARGVTEKISSQFNPKQNNPYSMSDEELQSMAQKLSSDPNLAHYATELNKAIQTGNNQKKDRIMFVLRTNTKTRQLLGLDLGEKK